MKYIFQSLFFSLYFSVFICPLIAKVNAVPGSRSPGAAGQGAAGQGGAGQGVAGLQRSITPGRWPGCVLDNQNVFRDTMDYVKSFSRQQI